MKKCFVILWFFISIIFVYIPNIAIARQDLVPGSRYTSARGAAIGDALIPLADDGASGLFYNPAGLAKIRHFQMELFNFQIQANADYLKILDRNFYKVFSLKNYASRVMSKEGSFPGLGAGLFPNFGARGFAFGIMFSDEFAATNAGNDNIRYRTRSLLIPTFGAGFRLAGGVIRIGYSFQWVNQAVGDITVPVSTDPLGYTEGLAEGSALSHNLGVAFTLPVQYLPAINFVVRNFLNARFSSFSLIKFAKNKNGIPNNELTSYDASFSLAPKIGGGSTMNYIIEYRDLTNRSGMHVLGRISMGLEFNFREKFFLRGGWRSGYLSAGVGMKRKTAEFGLSLFGEEFGSSYHEQKNTVYLLHYQIRAF
ncbi:MAG: hypothetical protein HY072_09125 [Deltaproteobacteria bacterium]|nr:hypothetical protein [Deltaproteobacteria bacterium]